LLFHVAFECETKVQNIPKVKEESRDTVFHLKQGMISCVLRPNYFTPSFFKITTIRHQFVNADCRRFAPTKAVNQYQYGCMKCASIRLIKIKVPAIALIYLLIIIIIFLLIFFYVEHNGPYGIITFYFLIEGFKLVQKRVDFVGLRKGEEQNGIYLR